MVTTTNIPHEWSITVKSVVHLVAISGMILWNLGLKKLSINQKWTAYFVFLTTLKIIIRSSRSYMSPEASEKMCTASGGYCRGVWMCEGSRGGECGDLSDVEPIQQLGAENVLLRVGNTCMPPAVWDIRQTKTLKKVLANISYK